MWDAESGLRRGETKSPSKVNPRGESPVFGDFTFKTSASTIQGGRPVRKEIGVSGTVSEAEVTSNTVGFRICPGGGATANPLTLRYLESDYKHALPAPPACKHRETQTITFEAPGRLPAPFSTVMISNDQ